jgi:hypothetical protein
MATMKKPAKKMQMGGKEPKKKTGMDALKAVGKYVSTFGGATERDNPKQKDINIVKKIKETAATAKKSLGLKSGGKVMKKGGSVDTYTNYSGKTSKPDSYTNYKMGGAVKAKNGKSFPDLNKDGKITKADILKGRGVIAKSGAKLKKQAAVAIAMKKAGKAPKKMQYGGAAASMVPPMMKKGGATKKCKYGCK